MNTLFIHGKRTGYTPKQCGETLTARELINALENLILDGELEDDSPIYLQNDNGYTFGEINDYNSFMVGEDYENAYDVNIYTE